MEFQLIDWIHEARERTVGIVINPAVFIHMLVAVLDPLSACTCPILEGTSPIFTGGRNFVTPRSCPALLPG